MNEGLTGLEPHEGNKWENFPFFGELYICKNIKTFTVPFDQVNAILAEWKY